jgi:hypothetical protein
MQTHFSRLLRFPRPEASLWQAPLQGHLSALKTDLVEAAGAGALTFVTTTTGFARTGADPATDALTRLSAARGGLQGIQVHHHASSTLSK